MKSVFLMPGQIHVAKEPTKVTTVLGSCVSVVLFDAKVKVVGINHYLLSETPRDVVPSPRYAQEALDQLLKGMERNGASLKRLQAKVFGGGDILAALSGSESIGHKNIKFAFDKLKELGIPIVEKDVGGKKGRRLSVFSDTSETEVVLQGQARKTVGSRSVVESMDNTGYGGVFTRRRGIKVLIVDDSATVRNIFQKVFLRNGLEVVGCVASAYEAREKIVALKPEVVTLDIEMPHMNGVAFLEKLMKHMPLPVVMVSSLQANGDAALKAMELGAVEFVHKPSQFDPGSLRILGETIVNKIQAAATVDVTRARQKKPVSLPKSLCGGSGIGKMLDLVAIGGNTGSQKSLGIVLESMQSDCPPIVVVNPTVSSFVESFIKKLSERCSLKLEVIQDGQVLNMGVAYFAPAEKHVVIEKAALGYVGRWVSKDPVAGQRPSSSVTLESVARVVGKTSLGILLGGFGSDGVSGLERIFDSGGSTIVEDPNQCLFPHVPQGAISAGVVQKILRAEDIAREVLQLRSQAVA